MIAKITHKYLDYKYRDVAKFISNPIETQERVLECLLKSGRDTLFGHENNFNFVKNKDDFRTKVPISHYEDLRPYLDKIIVDKQQNVLWNKPIQWFAMSSGTTEDRSKYIPVTRESLTGGHFRCGEQLLAVYAQAYEDVRFLLGKTMILGGSQQVNNIGDGIFTGDISAILIKNVYAWTKLSKTPEQISLIPDWEEKLDVLTAYAKKNDIRALMGVPSWMLVLLKRVKEETGKELTDLWPNLEVFFHGGVSFSPFREQYNKVINNPAMRYWETYNASEGFFGVQMYKDSRDMLLMLDNGIYYEFIPMDEWDKEKPRTLTLDEVEVGINYAMVISTNGGLWRYVIGDTIEFTSKMPYLFRITGRTKSFINAFGEELIVDNADDALKMASEATGAVVSEYTAAPIYFGDSNTGAHEWVIEFAVEPKSLDEFVDQLDAGLKKVNSDYDAKRSYNLSLGKPQVRAVKEGTFNKWLKYNNRDGGQNKIPRLVNNRDYMDRLLSYIYINIEK